MRRALMILAAGLACACGGSPASPSSSTTSGDTTSMRAGEHVVSLMLSAWPGAAGPNICSGGGIEGDLLPPPAQVGDTARFPAVVTVSGSTFTLRPTGGADL